jgi:hypothetical protein
LTWNTVLELVQPLYFKPQRAFRPIDLDPTRQGMGSIDSAGFEDGRGVILQKRHRPKPIVIDVSNFTRRIRGPCLQFATLTAFLLVRRIYH